MESGDDANALVADGDGSLDAVGTETEHEVGVAEGGGGDFDEEFIVAGSGDGNVVDQDSFVCLT